MEDKQLLLAQFMEVVSEPADRCRQFLEATNWQLEEAIQLFFAGGGADIAPPVAEAPPPTSIPQPQMDIPEALPQSGDDYVRPPLPVKREALYEDIFQYRAQRRGQPGPTQPTPVDAFRNFEDEFNSRLAKASGSSVGSGGVKAPTLATLYRPPLELNYEGNFEQAKAEAAKQGKWLLVNLQSHTEFSSHMLNRDTWSHEAVKDTVKITFIFWQIYDDTEEGKKVCTYYRLSTMPTIMVLDPLTGQKMRCWEGMVGAERLLEDLVQFMDRGPMENHTQKRPRDIEQQQQQQPAVQPQEQKHDEATAELDEDQELQRALAASLESQPEPMVSETAKARGSKYPALPEEPKPEEAETCRVGVRFPDGKRGQRRYFRSDPSSYLWSYCCLNVEEAAGGRKFRLTLTIPGGKSLEYDPSVTIDQAGVANAMLVMAWD